MVVDWGPADIFLVMVFWSFLCLCVCLLFVSVTVCILPMLFNNESLPFCHRSDSIVRVPTRDVRTRCQIPILVFLDLPNY